MATATRQIVTIPQGEEFVVWVDHPVCHGEDLVTFQSLTREVAMGEVLPSSSTLRFISPCHLRGLIQEQGFVRHRGVVRRLGPRSGDVECSHVGEPSLSPRHAAEMAA